MTSSALAERPTERQHLRECVANARLYVARVDFAQIRCGEKRVWRSYRLFELKRLPRPVIIASHHPGTGRIDTALAICVESWVEPLGSITDEQVAEEGFTSRVEFKRYFAARYPNVGYRPLQNVRGYRVRPLEEADRQAWLDDVWQRLYGRFA